MSRNVATLLVVVMVIVDAIVHSRQNDLSRLTLEHEMNEVFHSGLFNDPHSLRLPFTVTVALYSEYNSISRSVSSSVYHQPALVAPTV